MRPAFMNEATLQDVVDAVDALQTVLVLLAPWIQAIAIAAATSTGLAAVRLVLVGKNNRRLW